MGYTHRISIINHTESSSTGATDLNQVLRGFYEILSTKHITTKIKMHYFSKI